MAKESETVLVAELAAFTFRESWSEEGNKTDIDEYINEHFTVEKVLNELTDPSIIYLVAFNRYQPIGYVKLQRNLKPDNYDLEKPFAIDRVYVHKPFQGNKVGSQLLELAIDIAVNESYKTVWLGVWNENLAAIRLYERFGFHRFGTYQFIMGSIVSDDYLMMRKI